MKELELAVVRRLFNDQEWAFLIRHSRFQEATEGLENCPDGTFNRVHHAISVALDLLTEWKRGLKPQP